MIVSASKPPDQFTKGLSIKQTREDIEVICDLLMVKDTNRELCNFLLYLKRNKAKVAKQLLHDIILGQVILEVTKKKQEIK